MYCTVHLRATEHDVRLRVPWRLRSRIRSVVVYFYSLLFIYFFLLFFNQSPSVACKIIPTPKPDPRLSLSLSLVNPLERQDYPVDAFDVFLL